MLKRTIIAFFLAFTYTLVLAHSIVPHHHHESPEGIHTHEAATGHSHNGLPFHHHGGDFMHQLLAHFPHNADGGDLASCQLTNSSVLVKKNIGVAEFLPPVFGLNLFQVFSARLSHYTPYQVYFSCYTGSSSSLRAPPAHFS